MAAVSLPQLLLVWAVVVFAAIMRAFTGFGFALTAVPVFSLFMPPTQAVVLSASLTLGVSLVTLKTYWGHYPLRSMVPLCALSLVGTVAGAFALQSLSPDQFRLWIGPLVIVACALLTFYRPGKRQGNAAVAGGVGLGSGLMNGAFAMPGPPIIIYAMATEAQAARSRALLMTFFLFSAVVALASYTAAGYVNARSPWLFLMAFPAMLLGDKLGFILFHRYGDAFYRRVALMVLFTVGATITGRALLS